VPLRYKYRWKHVLFLESVYPPQHLTSSLIDSFSCGPRMHHLSTLLRSLFVLLSVISSRANAARVHINGTCVPYDTTDTSYHWAKTGTLTKAEAGHNGGLHMFATLQPQIDRDRKWNRYDTFAYTIAAGVGEKIGSELYVRCDRYKGKGMGQQFVVHFWPKVVEKESVPLGSYWITPMHRCTFDSPFAAADVGKIKVEHRLWGSH
jgi:hypothetical protein